jgi:gluconolactonase
MPAAPRLAIRGPALYTPPLPMKTLLLGLLAFATAHAGELFTVQRLDPALDALVPADVRIEKLAEGFVWTEGPVWRKSGGYLLFSDIPKNSIYRWREGEGLSLFLRPAGYSIGNDAPWELGSNALTFDAQDRLIFCDHGNRQVVWLNESIYTKTVLAAKYLGKRFNSPNDLVFKSNGDLYFTDPPYGLDGRNKDPRKEMDYNGVYRLSPQGELTLLTKEVTFPNGIAFSPDEKTLFIDSSDPARPVWWAYEVETDGTISHPRIFCDATAESRAGKAGLPDGMKVDREGNAFSAGPGGLWIISPTGRHLGTFAPTEKGIRVSNCAWGDDGSTLYFTATKYVMRVRLATKGAGW